MDNLIVPDLIAEINASTPVTHQLLTPSICGALNYKLKELDDYKWLQFDQSTSTIILAPESDALPGVYPMTLKVYHLEFPFQVTIKPEYI